MDARVEEFFRDKLLPGEHIQWAGKPERRTIFSRADRNLIPLSVGWAVGAYFLILRQISEFRGPKDWLNKAIYWFTVLTILEVLVGRFAEKTWWKGRTFYAVTDRNVMIKSPQLRPRLRFTSLPIGSIESISPSIRSNGVGSLSFGLSPSLASMYSKRSRLSDGRVEDWFGTRAPAFWDIEDAEYVCQLVERLRAQASTAPQLGPSAATQPSPPPHSPPPAGG